MRNNFSKKMLVMGTILMFLGTSFLTIVTSKENISTIESSFVTIQSFNGCNWTVDDEGDGDFTSIQDAIDASSDGETICVYSGEYLEWIEIENRENLLIKGYAEEYGNGTDEGKPKVDGLGIKNVFLLGENCFNIAIDGFEIINGSSTGDASGVWLKDCIGCKILNNTVRNSEYGIYLQSCEQGNTIKDNNIHSVDKDGIVVQNSRQYNYIHNNNIHDCGTNGIIIADASRNHIYSNTITDNSRCGVRVTSEPWNDFYRGNNEIINNIIENNGQVCEQWGSRGNNWNSNWWGEKVILRIKIIFFNDNTFSEIPINWPPIIDRSPLPFRPS